MIQMIDPTFFILFYIVVVIHTMLSMHGGEGEEEWSVVCLGYNPFCQGPWSEGPSFDEYSSFSD